MTNFTKGEWAVIPPDREHLSRAMVGSNLGADIYNAPLTTETLANAHLIAAAPEMYETLKGFMAVCQKFSDMLIQVRDHKKTDYWVVGQMDGLLDEYGAIADKAIAKAEGN